MKAVVRKSLEPEQMFFEDVPIPEVKENEVLIKVKAVGVCGTDTHMYTGHVVTTVPVIVGHEFCGIVEQLGKKVTSVKIGDKVVSRLNIGVCGICRNCLTGNPHMCEHRTCPGFAIHGAYAEYISMDEKMLLKLNAHIPIEVGATIEPMAIVAHALLERTKIEPEDFVVIFGPGPIGLISLQMANLYGARQVVMVGTNVDEKQRMPLARKIGASYILNAQVDDVAEEIMKLTNNKGADLVIEASGAENAINCGFRVLRRQGRMCVLGLPTGRELNISWLTAAEKALQVIFSYSSSPWSWNLVVHMVNRGAIDTSTLISHIKPLKEYKAMFEEIKKGQVIKGVLLP
ncbi:D-arabitol-phosphate dehydrogenase [Sporomusa rhizae]|uniref:zinc-dependent alcohol dehydrogenase n=1 Tax=Sporomusa rhizae TaxID=357999 RepID=UPI00352A4D0C